MMNILTDMNSMRNALIDKDRKEAMNTLVRKLHYEVAPLVTRGDSFTLFTNEYELNNFCSVNQLDMRAMKWLISEMRRQELIFSGDYPVVITPLCIEKFCNN